MSPPLMISVGQIKAQVQQLLQKPKDLLQRHLIWEAAQESRNPASCYNSSNDVYYNTDKDYDNKHRAN
ncbi:hypothetical protein MRX96_007670 [Rhipicephalus microplus]